MPADMCTKPCSGPIIGHSKSEVSKMKAEKAKVDGLFFDLGRFVS